MQDEDPSLSEATDGPYFHVAVQDGRRAQDERNLTARAVLERVAIPFRLNRAVRINGFEFQSTHVIRLRITRTDRRLEMGQILGEVDTSSLSSFFVGLAAAGQQLDAGTDVTDDLLKRADQLIAERNLTAEARGPLDVLVQPNKAFVVMSFAPELRQSFDAIVDTCRKFGINAVRADTEISSAGIMDRIILHLRESAYVIADLTQARPNVYYEIGYFDAICAARGTDPAKHLLLVARDIGTDAHFDLRHRGIEQYDNPYTLMKRVEAWLSGLQLTRS